MKEQKKSMRDLVEEMSSVLCPKCEGKCRHIYSNTATWKSNPGQVSGRAMTEDVCDACWGTGLTTKTGWNLRKQSRINHLTRRLLKSHNTNVSEKIAFSMEEDLELRELLGVKPGKE